PTFSAANNTCETDADCSTQSFPVCLVQSDGTGKCGCNRHSQCGSGLTCDTQGGRRCSVMQLGACGGYPTLYIGAPDMPLGAQSCDDSTPRPGHQSCFLRTFSAAPGAEVDRTDPS